MVSTSSITMHSLGEIELRAPGAKIWCLYVFDFLFVSHALRPARSSFEGVYFEQV